MPKNIVTTEALQERMTANAFNNWMGMKIQELSEDQIVVEIKWRAEMMSNPKAKVTHGGILGAVIDAVADFMIAAKVGIPVPTVDLRIDYHRAAMPGDLRCVGKIVRLGGTNSVAEAYVYDGDEKLIASGRGTYFTAAAKSKD
ncbi:MAG: PaaI family thioesterase [Pseudomonadota bacterium]|nr:phenylacetic acid degradation protein [Alphaproteobacteria bacterium]MEC7464180.1 PaaI family thioesterase [Pseudomonadota bacterium]MEC8087492.1 PaaI family thioesterase [Pseudomonadota bacterium]MEC8288474.1 PaaI family thioesterase [Pseudomonadota bacterium]MEC8726149.1 PaaI family thioesterase [Pseudomonadota bacterium]